MKKNNRRWMILGGALVLGLVVLARWMIHPDEARDVPSVIEATSPAESQPPAAAATVPANERSSKPTFVTFRGQVIDAVSRQPLREFEVQLERTPASKAGGEAPEARTFHSRNGRFEWPYLTEGEWTITANAAGYQRFILANVRLEGGPTPEVVLALRHAPRIRGRVFDEASGAPIGNARIMLETRMPSTTVDTSRMSEVVSGTGSATLVSSTASAKVVPNTTSANDGTFLLEALAPGRATLNVWAEHYIGRNVDIMLGDDMPLLQVALITGASVTGRLVASDGATPETGMISLSNLDQGGGEGRSTGPRGEFEFHSLVPGRYQLEGRAESGMATREIVLTESQRIDGIVLTLATGYNIRGMVTGLRPDELGHVRIVLSRDGAVGQGPDDVGVDDRGAFVIPGVIPGRVLLSAYTQVRRIWKTIQMPADSDVTVTLDFPRGVRLSGRITRGGEPLANVRVRPEPEPDAPPAVMITGALTSWDGTYVIEDVPRGKYVFRVGRLRSGSLHVAGDTVFDFDVPPGQLSGRVLSAQGQQPIAGAELYIWPAAPVAGQRPLPNLTDPEGKFTLDGLEPGEYMLSVYTPGHEMLRKLISFDAQSKELTLELREEGGVEFTARKAGSGSPINFIIAIEVIGDGRGSLLSMELDENGKGFLPRALAGSTLKFLADDCEPTIIESWKGNELGLQLEAASAH
jgi:hypothetical protein